MERLGEERARLLADNIELDQRAAELAEEIAEPMRCVNELAAAGAGGMRAALAAAMRSLKALRARVQDCAGKAVADRTRTGEEAGRTQVSRRDQPQGAELALEELAAATRPCSTRQALAEAEQQYQEVREAHRSAGPGESAGARRVPGGAAAL